MQELLNRFDTEVAPSHDLVALANAASFNNTYFNEALSTFAQGWRDPSDIMAELEFVAPLVEVPRRFSFRKFGAQSDFMTESDDERQVGGDFKRVEYAGEIVEGRTLNRGLTIFVDLDEVADQPNWQQQRTGWLLRRAARNDLATAAALLFAAASNTNKTWDTQADPDADLLDLVDAAGDVLGFNPGRIYLGAGAWSKRVKAFRSQDDAGGFASAGLTPDQVAAWLGIERLFVSRTRYATSASEKSKIVGAAAVAFHAESGQLAEDASHIKRFTTRCSDGQLQRVYVREVSEKITAITVERYVRTTVVSTLGLKKYTIL